MEDDDLLTETKMENLKLQEFEWRLRSETDESNVVTSLIRLVFNCKSI